MQVRDLEPKAIWNHFEDLNAVPRPSKKEERVIEFMLNFGKKLGLDTKRDACGNVIIKKAGTGALKDKPVVVLQSHIDMVHQKNNDSNFDFDTQGIESFIDGDWVTANGTTLGADNGMGVAAIMTLLASTDIEHPPLEGLFTIDEETGMTGAFNLDPALIEGRILLNLDTEEDDELSIGCAGGIDVNANWNYATKTSDLSHQYRIAIKGLKGGHSGMDIHTGRGNANKLLVRVINELRLNTAIDLHSFDGGSLRNAIPREAMAVISSSEDIADAFAKITDAIKKEFVLVEDKMSFEIEKVNEDKAALKEEDLDAFLATFQSVYNGVFRMSDSMPDTTETSSSLARIIVGEGKGMAQFLCRSSKETAKMDMARTIKASFFPLKANVELTGSYPGWTPNMDSRVLDLCVSKYKEMYGDEPRILAGHGGLECGILGEHFNGGMDMISFGPTIQNPHSPDERVNIKSVQKFWDYLLEILKNI